MAGKKIYNDKDSMDISELASLNEDISPEMIEQLQAKISQEAMSFSSSTTDDEKLFEEPVVTNNDPVPTSVADTAIPATPEPESLTPEAASAAEQIPGEQQKSEELVSKESESSNSEKQASQKPPALEAKFDDNFIKKYKAKLNKQSKDTTTATETPKSTDESVPEQVSNGETIENISNGKITEKAITQEQREYNDSLDYLDGNVKYSKYVIYIEPENVEFIESLTVKERKNLINGVLKGQHDVAVTKSRFMLIQTVIRHIIIAILTISISIPIIYYVINASLEASIDNHRRSQSNWQTLYREKGKIPKN